MIDTPLRAVPVHEINKRVMATEDIEMLSSWLEEEKRDAKRLFAMKRLWHRITVLKRARDFAEMDKIAREK